MVDSLSVVLPELDLMWMSCCSIFETNSIVALILGRQLKQQQLVVPGDVAYLMEQLHHLNQQ